MAISRLDDVVAADARTVVEKRSTASTLEILARCTAYKTLGAKST
jgi:hypothetical protein